MNNIKIEGFYEYVVPPLEGLWWQDGLKGTIDASRVCNIEALEGKDTISDVMIYYAESDEQFELQIAELEKYLKLDSYGQCYIEL